MTAIIIEPPKVGTEGSDVKKTYKDAVFFRDALVSLTVLEGLERTIVAVNLPISPEHRDEFEKTLRLKPYNTNVQVEYPSVREI